jgi:hypothetical protein
MNSTSSPLRGHSSSSAGLRVVGITTDLIIMILTVEIDQTCGLMNSCKLSQSLYVQEGAKYHPAVVTALGYWFSKLQLPLDMKEMYLSSAAIQEWKKVKRIDSDAGDTMSASSHSNVRDSRDSCYIRVCFPHPNFHNITHIHLVSGA